jgi:hypothetical protein
MGIKALPQSFVICLKKENAMQAIKIACLTN